MTWFRRQIFVGALALGFAMGAATALAQDYPTRPISLVVTFPAGGVVDVVARIVADEVGKGLAQPIVIQNKPGGDNHIGINAVLQAPADGYTLLTVAQFVVTTPMLRKDPFFKTSDFTPVALLGAAPNVIVTSPTVPAKTLKDFIAYARTRHGALNVATSFRSGSSYQTSLSFLNATGLEMREVPFKGAAEMIPSLASGDAHLAALPVLVAAPAIKAGKLTALAVASETRVPSLPDVPTGAEAGLPRGSLPTAWYALVAKAGTPDSAIQVWNREVNRALKSPRVVQSLADMGVMATPAPVAELRKRLSEEQLRWSALFKARNLQPE